MSVIKIIWTKRHVLRSIPFSLYFNLRYLPFRTAIKLPILLYKPRVISGGNIRIEAPVSYGMVRMGFPDVSIFGNNGITFENRGEIIFKGAAKFGNDVAISVNETGKLTFGRGFINTCGLKAVCYHRITVGNNVRVGWNVRLIDTDFHAIARPDGTRSRGYGAISIGDNVWIASDVKIYKGVQIPSNSIIGADTIMHKSPDCDEMNVITTSPFGSGYKYTPGYWQSDNDKIEYP